MTGRHKYNHRWRASYSSESELEEIGDDDKTCHLVDNLLKGGLLKTIEKVVKKQAALAFGNMETGSSVITHKAASDRGERASTSRSVDYPDGYSKPLTHVGDDMLDSFDPDNKDFRQAFSRQHDFAELLEELVARRKHSAESMTHYFHAKLEMCVLCDIGGEKAVSLLIRGLPEELRAGAFALNCETPQDLYWRFLAELDEHKTHKTCRKRLSERNVSPPGYKLQKRTPNTVQPQGRTEEQDSRLIRCFNCQELGNHMSRDCPQPRIERCSRCKHSGHVAADCTKARRLRENTKQNASTRRNESKIRMISNLDDSFKRRATAKNGDMVRVYLDAGSEHNLVSVDCASRLASREKRTNTILKGVDGGVTQALAEVSLELILDGETWAIAAMVTDCELSGADVILGQPVLA